MNQFEDINLVCLCGEPFVWSSGEQQFLQSLIDDGKTNRDGSAITFTQPKRCRECRAKKKEERARRENRNQNNDDY